MKPACVTGEASFRRQADMHQRLASVSSRLRSLPEWPAVQRYLLGHADQNTTGARAIAVILVAFGGDRTHIRSVVDRLISWDEFKQLLCALLPDNSPALQEVDHLLKPPDSTH